MRRCIILSLLFISSTTWIHSQSITFPPDKNISTSDLLPLIVGQEVKGYYSFKFARETKDKKNEYNLLIMDINFKITRDAYLTINNKVWFFRETFNGDQFCFTFANENAGVIEYYICDMEGKLVKLIHMEDVKKTHIYPTYMDNVYPVAHKGFFRDGINPKQEEYLEMIGMDGRSLWKIHPKEVLINGKNKGIEELSFYYADENYIVLNVDIPKLDKDDLKKQSDHFLRAVNLETGKQTFVVDKRHAKGFLVPMGVQADQDQITFFGQFFANDGSKQGYNEKENLGLYTMTYDATGKLLQEHFNTWKDDVSKFLKLNEQDQVDGNRNIWIQDIVGTASGKTFAIAEMYHRGFSNIAFSSGYAFVRDLLVFEFDADFKLTAVDRFEKYKSSYQLANIGFLSDYTIGEALDPGSFDYKFTSQAADRSVFNCVYDNFDKSDKSDKKFVIGAVGFNRDQELVNPKITLTTNPDDIKVLSAKPGYVAVIEYFKKDKYATLTLYKFDF